MTATVLVANPSADVYGADLQLLQSIAALRADGWRVVVATPSDGPLIPRVRALGAETVHYEFPVLRRSVATAHGTAGLAASSVPAVRRIAALIRSHDPALVYVNTLTLPWWLLAARTRRVPVVCHVHEAERSDPRVVRLGLAAPLRLATTCIVNSRATMAEILSSQPRLANRLRLVHNGVPGPPEPLAPPPRSERTRLVVVGRLSERKGVHVAVEAVALLLRRGQDVELELCGSAVDAQSPYLAEIVARCEESDLRGRVRMSGYTSPIWPALARSDILVAPSFGESFGNAVVEAQLAGRPVVATAVQGHLETVTNNETGLLVPLDDPGAIATAVGRLIAEPGLAAALAAQAMRTSSVAFAPERYDRSIASVARTIARAHPSKTAPDLASQT